MRTGWYEITIRYPDGSTRTAKVIADNLKTAKRYASRHGKVIKAKVITRSVKTKMTLK